MDKMEIQDAMESGGPIAWVATLVGSSEAALRLLYSIILGYPIAFFHRKYLFGAPPNIQHVYFIVAGLSLGFYNFGYGMLHTTANIILLYCLLITIGGTIHSVLIAFVLNMGLLIYGYIYTSTDSYDISWTMPQCILALKLTGLAFDLYDGSLPEEKLSRHSKKLAIREVPTILELAAFSYFPTAFLVGPQFSMRKYKDFVAGKLKGPETEFPECVSYALGRGLLGVFYLAVFTYGSIIFPDDYLLSQDFQNRNFFMKMVELGLWGHIALYKYISIWLICEGSCVLIGLGYNGTDKDGNCKWDGCANVKVGLFETATVFNHYIDSFNLNTNFWVFQYIYKRLIFLNNKNLSQIGVLLFLSIWHGFHSGYYVCFASEFVAILFEKDVEIFLSKNQQIVQFFERPGINILKWFILKFYTITLMGPCIATLTFLKWHKYWPILKTTYCYAQVFWLSWFFYKPLLKKFMPRQKVVEPGHEHKE